MKNMINRILSLFGIVKKDSHTAAVVIGVENGRYGNCPGATADSHRIAALLRKYTDNVTLLQNSSATLGAVRLALSRYASKELVVIYYSGHGGQSGSGDASEADHRDEYLCLYDGSLSDNEIWKTVTASRRTFLIFDCCHSETMYRAIQARASAVSAMGQTPEMLCWSGCPDNTYSYGDSMGGKFTNALLKAYSAGKSYDEVWNDIEKNKSLVRYQTPRRTKYGKWNTLVFR